MRLLLLSLLLGSTALSAQFSLRVEGGLQIGSLRGTPDFGTPPLLPGQSLRGVHSPLLGLTPSYTLANQRTEIGLNVRISEKGIRYGTARVNAAPNPDDVNFTFSGAFLDFNPRIIQYLHHQLGLSGGPVWSVLLSEDPFRRNALPDGLIQRHFFGFSFGGFFETYRFRCFVRYHHLFNRFSEFVFINENESPGVTLDPYVGALQIGVSFRLWQSRYLPQRRERRKGKKAPSIRSSLLAPAYRG